jgi:hypothetical protein
MAAMDDAVVAYIRPSKGWPALLLPFAAGLNSSGKSR